MKDVFVKPYIGIVELDGDVLLASDGSECRDLTECDPVACSPEEEPPPPCIGVG